jgi:thiamine biosynthesis lipoprotein
MSEWRPDTELSAVNQSAGAKPVKVSADLFDAIDFALKVSEKSDGAFDPTFNAFWGLYDFKKGQEREPSEEEIRERLPLINFKNVALDREKKTVFLKKPGMKLGLGGMGQGYGVDRVVTFLKSKKYVAGFVDGSGDTYYWGKKPSGELWTTGIRDPRDHDKVIARVYGTDMAVTTCGDDEKFFMKNGRRVHHVIDPKTGHSSTASRQVTVIARHALDADAWDTASFVLGPEKAKKILSQKGFEAVIVGGDEKIHFTRGLKLQKTKWGEVYVLPDSLK